MTVWPFWSLGLSPYPGCWRLHFQHWWRTATLGSAKANTRAKKRQEELGREVLQPRGGSAHAECCNLLLHLHRASLSAKTRAGVCMSEKISFSGPDSQQVPADAAGWSSVGICQSCKPGPGLDAQNQVVGQVMWGERPRRADAQEDFGFVLHFRIWGARTWLNLNQDMKAISLQCWMSSFAWTGNNASDLSGNFNLKAGHFWTITSPGN